MMGERAARSPRKKKSEFLVNLDHFSKYLKYLRNFEKRSKLTKNSDFLARGERATLSHHLSLLTYDSIVHITHNKTDQFCHMTKCPKQWML